MIAARYLGSRLLNLLRLEVRRIPAFDEARLAAESLDPLTCEYMPRLRGRAIFDIAIDEARAFHSLALPIRCDSHPFAMAMAAAEGSDDPEPPIRRVLASYYREVCPATALEAMGCSEDDAPGMRGVPVLGYLLPWWGKSIEQTIAGRERAMRLVARQYGMKATAEHGLTAFGPASDAKLDLEVARLCKLVQSIRRHGFKVHTPESPARVTALRKGQEYRWLIEEGQHRFAAAAAFGIKGLPATVAEIVRFEDAAYWPHVVNGNMTPCGAEALFDRVFDALPAPVCGPWLASRQGC